MRDIIFERSINSLCEDVRSADISGQLCTQRRIDLIFLHNYPLYIRIGNTFKAITSIAFNVHM